MTKKLPSSHKLWVSAKDYIFIIFGLLLYSFGFCAFIFPEKVIMGGLTGIATIIYFLTGIPVAISNYGINLILLAMAYRTVGKQFVLRSIFGASVLSLFIGIMQPMFNGPLVQGEPFMNVIIGAICCGLGVGLIFVHNGSSGGTDIIAAMVNKVSNVSIGRSMLYFDCITISSSFLLFHHVDKVVYGFITLFILTFMVDFVINTNRQAVQFTIFSRKWEEIASAINSQAHRGCTVIDGMGWYSKESTKILMVMCRKIESVTIFRIIKSIDNDAFIAQANVNGVYGKGFDNLKVKIKKDAGQK